MSTLFGDTGRVSIGTFKRFDITMATPWEDNIALSSGNSLWTNNLPITSGSAITATFTIKQTDLPTIFPYATTGYCAYPVVGGYNPNSSTATISGNWLYNGTQVTGGSINVQAGVSNRNWMLNMAKFPSVNVGDTISVQLYANMSNVTFEYMGLMVAPTMIQMTKPNAILKDLYVGPTSTASLTQNFVSPYTGTNTGTLSSPNQNGGMIMLGSSNATSGQYLAFNTGANYYSFPCIASTTNYLYRQNGGDYSLISAGYSHSSLKYYIQPKVPQYIYFREVSL
jgi:hypothetical protein